MPETPLARFEAALKGRGDDAKRAAQIVALAPRLPERALPLMDRYLDRASPLVKVAIMDAYFEMTDDDYHEDDLIAILDAAKRQGDAGEETYMAARMALSRIYQREGVARDPWGIGDLEILGVRVAPERPRALRRRRPTPAPSITIIIHGTWAADGKWWRNGGDFFDYVRRDLQRRDLYGKIDQYRWSGKNRDRSRRKAATSLKKWLAAHPCYVARPMARLVAPNLARRAPPSVARSIVPFRRTPWGTGNGTTLPRSPRAAHGHAPPGRAAGLRRPRGVFFRHGLRCVAGSRATA